MPKKTGPSVERELPQQTAEPVCAVGVELAQVHGSGHCRGALLLRLHHRLEDRPVGLEHPEAPLPRSDGLEGDAAGVRRDPRRGGYVEFGHACELFERDAHERIGRLVLSAVGGDAERKGAGGLEPTVA